MVWARRPRYPAGAVAERDGGEQQRTVHDHERRDQYQRVGTKQRRVLVCGVSGQEGQGGVHGPGSAYPRRELRNPQLRLFVDLEAGVDGES